MKLKLCSCSRPVRRIPDKTKESVKMRKHGGESNWIYVYPSKQAKDGLCLTCFHLKSCGVKDIQPNYVSGGILPSNENGRKLS